MIFGYLTLFVALAISAVAAWYSIIGLMAIFSASAVAIAIMGGVLEVGKVLTASWLYQNWNRDSVFTQVISDIRSVCPDVHYKYGHLWISIKGTHRTDW
jgi:hypothetical protein